MIHAFADDTRHDAVIVAAAAALREERLAEAEMILSDLKEAAGLPKAERLHCKVMFMGDARRGTPWASLKPEAIYDLARTVCLRLKDLSERPLISVIDPRPFAARPVVTDGPPLPSGPQAIASLAYGGLWSGFARRYPVGTFRMWIDPDPTKVQWGLGRRRADATRGIFIDFGPDVEPPDLDPEVPSSDVKPPLLELADVYAYVAAQVHLGREGRSGRWYTELYNLIDPERGVFTANPETPKWIYAKEGKQ